MAHISKTIYHYVYAYKHQFRKQEMLDHLDLAYMEISLAQDYLMESQHGLFYSWYSRADPLKRTFQNDRLKIIFDIY